MLVLNSYSAILLVWRQYLKEFYLEMASFEGIGMISDEEICGCFLTNESE